MKGGLSNSSRASHGAKQENVVKTEAPCWKERRRQAFAVPAANIGPRPEMGGRDLEQLPQARLSSLGSHWGNSRGPFALRSPTSTVFDAAGHVHVALDLLTTFILQALGSSG